MKVSIIGLGLMGGSFSLALKKRFETLDVFGWDVDKAHEKEAMELGIIDQVSASLEDAVKEGEWIFLAVPVHKIEWMLPGLLDKISDRQVVVDFGSTKEAICGAVTDHAKRNRYVAAHPIAGTEYSGPRAACDHLYEKKTMVVCEPERSDRNRIDEFRKWCKILGMDTVYLSAADHDTHLAYISHLSHVIAFGLSNTVLKKEGDDEQLLRLAGSGFDSTVRLAKSSPEMWTPIMMKNKRAILESLDSYIAQMNTFRKLLDRDDEQGIGDFLKKGRKIKRILK